MTRKYQPSTLIAAGRRFLATAAILGAAALALPGHSMAAGPAAAGMQNSAGEPTVMPIQYARQRFDYPTRRGAVVDWCASWATDCGWGGAHLFCQQRGFPQATSWDIFFPGRTYVIGSRRLCEGNFCHGFLFVECG